jgi:hypothetical protein
MPCLAAKDREQMVAQSPKQGEQGSRGTARPPMCRLSHFGTRGNSPIMSECLPPACYRSHPLFSVVFSSALQSLLTLLPVT